MLRSLRGWHVIEGVVKRTGKRAQQKEIDILIAVDMLTHTYRRNMHRATFIAGDQDFRPLVEAIVRDGMFIELWYGSASVSSELMLAVDAHFKMSPYFIHGKLDRKYRDRYSLPQHFGSPDKSTEEGILIECGTDADNNSIELYQSNEQFILIRPDDYNDGYFLHMRHPDLDFLKKIHQLTYTKCDWTRVV